MIDQLIKLVEQNAGDTIVRNKALPDQYNQAAIEDVARQIFSGMQGKASQGNFGDIASMFQGSSSSGALSSNPMVSQIINSITSSLASKFGVSPQAAQSIAGNLIPQVLNQFVNKTNNPNDNDFDLQDIMRSVSGNKGLDLGDVLGKLGGSSSGGLGDLGDTLGKMFGR